MGALAKGSPQQGQSLNRSSHVPNFGGRGMNVCDCRRSGFERRMVRAVDSRRIQELFLQIKEDKATAKHESTKLKWAGEHRRRMLVVVVSTEARAKLQRDHAEGRNICVWLTKSGLRAVLPRGTRKELERG